MNRTLLLAIARGTCLSVAFLVVGCQQEQAGSLVEPQTNESDAVTIVEDSQPTEEQRGALLAAKDALFQQLSGKLMAAMAQGPAEAIAVCQKESSEIARSVGEEQGVNIGRVGVRLRNPKNTGPAWAASMVESQQDTPVFANLSNGNAAALLPIKLQGQCLMCHGSKQQIAPTIQDQLAKLYPNDQATGFREGELRGWFWVEQVTQ
ncbi:hypothetical protein Poly51_60080 [Rubripirellula tenax]|uniref:Tll0287-like domain-containing protein n=1 Tax=Rubripirellula tenax TaxID=2528015 RepID=A0A5C6E9I0_9BACT|nr:DUF3365 domain-containing protein [Rubripirellula tenax]TWU44577.1 hypothetical protein Poly51_60080 [Rubripirellula tenax]